MKRHRRASTLARRDFLKVAGVGVGAILLNGCAPRLLRPTAGATVVRFPTLTFVPISPATATATPTRGPSPTPTHTSPPTETFTPSSTPTRTSTPTGTPDPRKLCFVLWDHQLARYNYKPRNLNKPLPETCPLRSGAKISLKGAWETYWRGILHVCNPEITDEADFEGRWQSLVAPARAFTNKSGPESGGFGIHSLTCGGATHEMVTGIAEGDYMRIYTLNGSHDPPQIPSSPKEINMTRHFFATTGSNKRLSDGSYAVFGFPQFENCIVPLVSPEDTDLIELSRIKVVTSIQRPYNTEPVVPGTGTPGA